MRPCLRLKFVRISTWSPSTRQSNPSFRPLWLLLRFGLSRRAHSPMELSVTAFFTEIMLKTTAFWRYFSSQRRDRSLIWPYRKSLRALCLLSKTCLHPHHPDLRPTLKRLANQVLALKRYWEMPSRHGPYSTTPNWAERDPHALKYRFQANLPYAISITWPRVASSIASSSKWTWIRVKSPKSPTQVSEVDYYLYTLVTPCLLNLNHQTSNQSIEFAVGRVIMSSAEIYSWQSAP